MKKQEIIKYLQSIIAVPMLAIIMPLPGITPIVNLNKVPVIITEENSVITTPEEVIRKKEANLIDTFFAKNKAPLEGYGMKFVIEAQKNNLDWRLLPAIAMRETSGGKNACKNVQAPNNNFGWFSCRTSINQSIEYISLTLGGNNINSPYYKLGMTSAQILKKYNPDYIVPGYSEQVIRIMKTINSTNKVG